MDKRLEVGDTAVIKEKEEGWARDRGGEKVLITNNEAVNSEGRGNYKVQLENGKEQLCSDLRLREPTIADGSYKEDSYGDPPGYTDLGEYDKDKGLESGVRLKAKPDEIEECEFDDVEKGEIFVVESSDQDGIPKIRRDKNNVTTYIDPGYYYVNLNDIKEDMHDADSLHPSKEGERFIVPGDYDDLFNYDVVKGLEEGDILKPDVSGLDTEEFVYNNVSEEDRFRVKVSDGDGVPEVERLDSSDHDRYMNVKNMLLDSESRQSEQKEKDRIEPGDKVICTKGGYGVSCNNVDKGFIALEIDEDTRYNSEDKRISIIPVDDDKKHAISREEECLRKATEEEKKNMTFHGEEAVTEAKEHKFSIGDEVRIKQDTTVVGRPSKWQLDDKALEIVDFNSNEEVAEVAEIKVSGGLDTVTETLNTNHLIPTGELEEKEKVIARKGDIVRVIPDYDGENSNGITRECYKWSNLMTPLTLTEDWKVGDCDISVKDKGGEVRSSDLRWCLPSDIVTTTEPSFKDYEKNQEESDLEVGDKVRITRSAERHERGWDNGWVDAYYAGDSDSMDRFIDCIVTISRFVGDSGIAIEESDKKFPFFVMEKVEESQSSEESEDDLYPETDGTDWDSPEASLDKEETHDRRGFGEGDLVYMISAGFGAMKEWKDKNVILEIEDFNGYKGNPRVKPNGADREPLSINAQHLSSAEDLEFGSSLEEPDGTGWDNPVDEVSPPAYQFKGRIIRSEDKRREKKLLL